MPEVQEVFRMATQKVRPDPGALERMHRDQRRQVVKRRAGGYALLAALLVAGVLIGISALQEEAPRPGAPASTPAPDERKAHYARNLSALDLNTGEMSPLPIREFGGSILSDQYAASPDGSRLAYARLTEGGSRQIFVAGIDGSGVRQVTHDPIGAVSPAWSPDGTKIAYVRNSRSFRGNLFVVDVATGESTKVTDELVAGPQFTPDGSSLLYTIGSDQGPVLRTVPVAGGESTLLIGPGEGVEDAGNGSMSPDGSLVTFLGGGFPESGEGHCGPCRFVANADGTDRRVIPGWTAIPAGTWSPDGTRIVSMDFRGQLLPDIRQSRYYEEIIVVTNVETGEATRVAEGRSAIWLNDHTLLIQG